jgi:hypothetical protein
LTGLYSKGKGSFIFGLQCYPQVQLLGYMDRVLTHLFSMQGLYSFVFSGGQL